jgi:hypothetical protein
VATVGRSRSVFRALPCEDPLQTHETGNAVAPAGAGVAPIVRTVGLG